MVHAPNSHKTKEILKNRLRYPERSPLPAEESLKHQSYRSPKSLHEIQAHNEKSLEVGAIKRVCR